MSHFIPHVALKIKTHQDNTILPPVYLCFCVILYFLIALTICHKQSAFKVMRQYVLFFQVVLPSLWHDLKLRSSHYLIALPDTLFSFCLDLFKGCVIFFFYKALKMCHKYTWFCQTYHRDVWYCGTSFPAEVPHCVTKLGGSHNVLSCPQAVAWNLRDSARHSTLSLPGPQAMPHCI